MKTLLTLLYCGGLLLSHEAIGDVLRDRISQVLRTQVANAVENQPGLLKSRESQVVLTLLKESERLPFDLIELKEISARRFEDRSGNPALLSMDGSRMLDSRGEFCDARVVREIGSTDWIIQLDLHFWRGYLSPTEKISDAAAKLLFHEVLRLAWHRNLIAVSDERSVISNQLKLDIPDLAGAGLAAAHLSAIAEGDEFEGEMACEDASFNPHHLFDFSEDLDMRRCRARLVLGKFGTAKYEVRIIADSKIYLSVDGHYEIRDRNLFLTKDEERKEFQIGKNNDHFTSSGAPLFRVDRGAPSVLGKTFGAEMFCRSAQVSLNYRWYYWEPIHPGFNFYEKICTAEIKIGATGDYVATVIGDKEPLVLKGKIMQIGHNLILKPPQEDRELRGAYFWIARGRNGSELVSTWGEFLFEDRKPQRPALFNLAKEYAGEGNCGFFPGVQKPELELCDYRLKIDYPRDGLVEIELVMKDGTKHVETGLALRSGSIYALWFWEKIKRSWNFRILNDRLEDGFGNRLLPVQAPLSAIESQSNS